MKPMLAADTLTASATRNTGSRPDKTEYAPTKAVRQASSHADLLLVEGSPPGMSSAS